MTDDQPKNSPEKDQNLDYSVLETEMSRDDLPLLKDNPNMNTSNPYESSLSNKNQTFYNMLKDILKNLKVTLPSIFSVGDYLIVELYLKCLVAHTRNL
jgi:hypothetical protein